MTPLRVLFAGETFSGLYTKKGGLRAQCTRKSCVHCLQLYSAQLKCKSRSGPLTFFLKKWSMGWKRLRSTGVYDSYRQMLALVNVTHGFNANSIK